MDITLVTAEQLPRLPCDDDISECADHRPHGRSNCGSFCSNRQLSTSDSQVLDEYTQPFEENRSLGLTGDGDTDKMAWECGKQELLGEQVRKATRNGEHFGPIGCAGEHDDSPCRGLTKGLFLRFAVTDTGVGVPDSLQPQLFRAFSQVQAMQNTGEGIESRPSVFISSSGLLRSGNSVILQTLRMPTCGSWVNALSKGENYATPQRKK